MLHEMMAETVTPAKTGIDNPLAPRAPMFPAKAKRVIFLYMSGGVSHVDTFDPKPRLQASHRQAYNDDFLHASPFKFSRYAKCDTEVSELFPHVGSMMDDICLIRSMRERSAQPLQRSSADPRWLNS